MADHIKAAGLRELRAVRRESMGFIAAVAVFSLFVNLLMLAGPLYMLNVYDRVLGSRSIETLVALTALVAFLYLTMAALDYARGRVMGRVGARFQARLDRRVFEAVAKASAGPRPLAEAGTGLRDLEAIQRKLTSPAFLSLFDLPWTPLFFVGIYLFHPWLGAFAVAGGVLLVALALGHQRLSRSSLQAANAASVDAERISAQIRDSAGMVQSLGMQGAAFSRWKVARDASLETAVAVGDVTGLFLSASKSLRLLLQSTMLGLGAFLVLRGELTPGAMIAGSILLGRALAPVEQGINHWEVFQRAKEGWDRLALLLGEVGPDAPRTRLPRPRALVDVRQITVVPPGKTRAALRMLTLRAGPGQAIGIIGPSGAGKSTFAKALTGNWKPAAGTIRLDGATLDQYEPDALGGYIGYLPQSVRLFEGTIRDNIARMAIDVDDAAVVRAARRAGAHEMVLSLPDGYDTHLDGAEGQLSGGQIQMIGLARALYGDPVVLVLDEPNSNLDDEGNEALNAAVRDMKAEGKCVFVVAHRPAAIKECDTLLLLENGVRRAYGPKDGVLRARVRNHQQITRAAKRAGEP